MTSPDGRSPNATQWKRWFGGPTSQDRSFLYEEIASLAGAGIGLREALAQLRDRASGRRARALALLADAAEHDVPPGDAMARHPDVFPPSEAALVRTAERTGRYDRSFRDAAAEVDRARAARRALVRAVGYPLFLLHFGICVSGCAFVNATHGAGAARLFVVVALSAIWVTIWGAWTFHVARRGESGWGRTIASIPLLGTAVRSGALARAFRVAAALQGAGTTLPESLHAAAAACGNGWIAGDLGTAAERARRGESAASSLATVAAFDATARSLLETGDRTGTLDAAFGKLAVLEEERFETASKRIAVAVGAVIFGGVALGVFWMMSSLLTRSFGGF